MENKWIDALSMQPDKTVNTKRFSEQYAKNTATWDKLFEFLTEHNMEAMDLGKYPIDGEKCFAIVSEYDTKEIEDAKIESHKKYIDLQHVISGEEYIGLVPLDKTTITSPYNEEKDVILYRSEQVSYYPATNETFFLFFPDEVHQPGIQLQGKRRVKKLVIKINNVA